MTPQEIIDNLKMAIDSIEIAIIELSSRPYDSSLAVYRLLCRREELLSDLQQLNQ